MALREFIAYGFAVLPEVIDIIGRNLQREMKETTGGPTTPTTTSGAWYAPQDRRLEEETQETPASFDKHIDEVEEGEMFDEIAVDISDIQYTIDHQLMASLIHNRAFDLIDDGRKRELGKIKIVGFNIESRHPLLNEISGKSERLGQVPTSFSSVNKVTGMLALLSVASVAFVLGAIAMVRGRWRSTKHAQRLPMRDLEESDQEMPAGVLASELAVKGYERVSSEA
jgi:hypothetical protein